MRPGSTDSPLARCVICGAVVQLHPRETRREKRCAGCVGEALQVGIVEAGGVRGGRAVSVAEIAARA